MEEAAVLIARDSPWQKNGIIFCIMAQVENYVPHIFSSQAIMWDSTSVPMDPTYTVNFFTQEIHVLAIVILCPIKTVSLLLVI